MFESCFQFNPLNPDPSASESFNPLIFDWKSISVVPKTPAMKTKKDVSNLLDCFLEQKVLLCTYNLHATASYLRGLQNRQL